MSRGFLVGSWVSTECTEKVRRCIGLSALVFLVALTGCLTPKAPTEDATTDTGESADTLVTPTPPETGTPSSDAGIPSPDTGPEIPSMAPTDTGAPVSEDTGSTDPKLADTATADECVDECEKDVVECNAEGTLVQTCVTDDDGCLVWEETENCDDDNVCTDDTCADATCSNTNNTATCDDDDDCTYEDLCDVGNCKGTPYLCDDSDTCTDDVCLGDGTCDHPYNTVPCDDNDYCTHTDVCADGFCQGESYVCDDLNVCTDDTCLGDGFCSFLPNAGSCNDGNPCTTLDICKAGVCEGCSAMVCTALDECHLPGVCDPDSGGCTNPPKADGTACDDDDLCTEVDSCEAGVCTGNSPVDCGVSAECQGALSCDPATGLCSSDTTDPEGTSCDDGDACTQIDTCQAGACVGGTPVICGESTQCTDGGTCDPITGLCDATPKPDGTTCDDDNACTVGDTCEAGDCVSGPETTCTALGECHTVGTCDPGTGVCSNPVKADGVSCDDDDACTQVDTCEAGSCVGSSPIVCTATDQCHNEGACNTTTGVCTDPVKADGTSCDDDNVCTIGDICTGGVCVAGANGCGCTVDADCASEEDGDVCNGTLICDTSGDPSDWSCVVDEDTIVVCSTLDDTDCKTNQCDAATGACSMQDTNEAGSCDDGDLCTQVDTCEAGVCVGSNDVVCTASDQCHDVGTCEPTTGECTDPAKADGTTCDDENACTENDTCEAGVCEAGTPKLCPASDNCHTVGVCDASTGVCSDPVKADGTSCSDGDACTQSDTCQTGVCVGESPVVCTQLDSCHTVGTCDSTTGSCSNPVEPDGTVCDTDYECESGVCVPAKEWTVMAYIMADNNLEEMLTGDIGHILANSWGSNDEVNLVWEVDFYPGYNKLGCPTGYTGAPCIAWRSTDYTNHVRWFWNSNSAVHLETLPEASDTVESYHDFIVWAVTNYPAKKYAVLFWDHGGGFYFGEDESEGAGLYRMTNTDIAEGISTGLADAGLEKFDLMIWYACLMATWESVLEFADYTDWMIASEEIIYGYRWRAMQDLLENPTATPKEFGQYWIDHFLPNWSSPGLRDMQLVTLFDMSYADVFIDAMNDVIDLLSDNLEDIYLTVALAQADAIKFQPSLNCPSGVQLDLGNVLDYLVANIDGHPDIVNAAQTARDHIDDLVSVLDVGKTVEDATGIAIYLPDEGCYNAKYDKLGPLHDKWRTFLKDFWEVFEEDTTPPVFASENMVQSGSGFTWSGQLDPTTDDLKSLFWGWAKFMDETDLEGGWMWLQGQEPIDYNPDLSFSFEHDRKRLVVYDGDTCSGAGSNLCAWGLIQDRETTSANSELLTIPMWYNDAEWVKWYGSYDFIQQETTTADYFIIDGDANSGLEPLPGSTFNALYLAKWAYAKYPDLFGWGTNPTIFDATADMKATYVDIAAQSPMVYILRATDIFDNQSTVIRCSGNPNTYILDLIVDGIRASDGAVYPHDAPGDPADFKWRMWKNGVLFYSSPYVLNEHKAQFRAFFTALPGDTFWMQLLEVDAGSVDEIYLSTTLLTTIVNTARVTGFGSASGLVGTYPYNAHLDLKVRKCLNY